MSPSADKIIADLQSQLAFQEHELDKLHQALVDQQQRIERLELQLHRLAEEARELRENQPGMPANEKPPHY